MNLFLHLKETPLKSVLLSRANKRGKSSPEKWDHVQFYSCDCEKQASPHLQPGPDARAVFMSSFSEAPQSICCHKRALALSGLHSVRKLGEWLKVELIQWHTHTGNYSNLKSTCFTAIKKKRCAVFIRLYIFIKKAKTGFLTPPPSFRHPHLIW